MVTFGPLAFFVFLHLCFCLGFGCVLLDFQVILLFLFGNSCFLAFLCLLRFLFFVGLLSFGSVLRSFVYLIWFVLFDLLFFIFLFLFRVGLGSAQGPDGYVERSLF